MVTDQTQLVWDCGCAGTVETPSGSRLEVGPDTKWTPEQLLSAAAESALLTSFMALAEENGLDLLGYVSSAATETATEAPSDIRVVIRPCIVVARAAEITHARDLLKLAIGRSPVARLLTSVLCLDPEVVVAEPS